MLEEFKYIRLHIYETSILNMNEMDNRYHIAPSNLFTLYFRTKFNWFFC